MKKTIILISIVLISNVLVSQTSTKETKGLEYFEKYSFTQAIKEFEEVNELSVEGQRNLALSYKNIGEYAKSAAIYSGLVNSEVAQAEDYYNYASVVCSMGDYDQSISWLRIFAKLAPNDLRAKSFIQHVDELSKMSTDNGNYVIESLSINTDQQEFGPAYFGDGEIVFTSSRRKVNSLNRKYNWDQKPFLDLYLAQVDSNDLIDPRLLDKTINTKMNDGPASFSEEGNQMVITRNNREDEGEEGNISLQIQFLTKQGDEWKEDAPFEYNNSDYSITHPWLSKKGDILFFASDMPGGFGGADIYQVKKLDNGKWGMPENLGDKVNTEGNEVSPYLLEDKNLLFFSSDGHFGLGGLDIFIAHQTNGGYKSITNAGYPLNTNRDDFSMIIADDMKGGYFSSNREGGEGDDDIYHFQLVKTLPIPKYISGVVKDVDGVLVEEAVVNLLDSSGHIYQTYTTSKDGKFEFVTQDESSEAIISGQKEVFQDFIETIDLSEDNYNLDLEIILDQVADPQFIPFSEFTFDGNDFDLRTMVKEIVESVVIYFDHGQYSLGEKAKEKLDQVVHILKEYPDLKLEVNSYTDVTGPVDYNQNLSEKRTAAVENYIKSFISDSLRIEGKSWGESMILNGCLDNSCTEDENQINRRSELKVVQYEIEWE